MTPRLPFKPFEIRGGVVFHNGSGEYIGESIPDGWYYNTGRKDVNGFITLIGPFTTESGAMINASVDRLAAQNGATHN